MSYGDPPPYNDHFGRIGPIDFIRPLDFGLVTDECDCVSCVAPHPLQAITDAPAAHQTIIGFTGPIGAGKSAAARYLIERHGFARGKFAAALKEMLRTLLRYRGVSPLDIDRMIEGDLKEIPAAALNGRTPRHAMETLGTEWGRNCISPMIWIDTELDARQSDPLLVFDDVRYPNEADAIRAAGGALIRIERPDYDQPRTTHASGSHTLPTLCTLYNTGTLAELFVKVDKAVRDLSWGLAAAS